MSVRLRHLSRPRWNDVDALLRRSPLSAQPTRAVASLPSTSSTCSPRDTYLPRRRDRPDVAVRPRIIPWLKSFWNGSLVCDEPAVVEHLVPEARVEQVQHGVLDAADVEVDRHPVALRLRRTTARRVVVRVEEAQVVPARARPLRHGVGLAHARACPSGSVIIEPVVAGARQRRLAVGRSGCSRRAPAARPAARSSGTGIARAVRPGETIGNGSPQ